MDKKSSVTGVMGIRSQREHSLSRVTLAVAVLAAASMIAAFDPAAASNRLREKDVNLDIARRVEARLEAAGVRVYMTRTTDRTVSLASRVALANAKRVDAFVSIHNNSSSNHAANGTEVYRQIHGSASAALGDALRRELGRSPGLPTSIHARVGSHGDYYYVLRNTRVPAVIVEGAYVSNASDAKRLASATFRQAIADSIANGILDYQRTLVGTPLPATTTPSRVALPALGAPGGAAGNAINARTVSLEWDASPAALAYNVYRDGVMIGRVDNSIGRTGRMSFTDIWAAPGQSYTYEIAQSVSLTNISIESAPARVVARTPTIVVALDPGHGGADPGSIGSY